MQVRPGLAASWRTSGRSDRPLLRKDAGIPLSALTLPCKTENLFARFVTVLVRKRVIARGVGFENAFMRPLEMSPAIALPRRGLGETWRRHRQQQGRRDSG